MGIRRTHFGFIFLLFCSSMAASSSSTESSYNEQTNIEKHGKDGVTNRIGRSYSANAVTVPQRVGRGNSASGGGRDGGGSRPRLGGGGTAIIPIYAAGSARARHHQGQPRNVGTRHENNMGLLVAVILVVITHMYKIF